MTSCGTIHHLPGHNNNNEGNPPDITMRKGEKKRVLTSGIERLGISLPPHVNMQVEDNIIVEIEGMDWVAYLVARNTGTTRVRYSPRSDGFLVHVVDTQKNSAEQAAPSNH